MDKHWQLLLAVFVIAASSGLLAAGSLYLGGPYGTMGSLCCHGGFVGIFVGIAMGLWAIIDHYRKG